VRQIISDNEQVFLIFLLPGLFLIYLLIRFQIPIFQFDDIVVQLLIPDFYKHWHFPLLILPVVEEFLYGDEVVLAGSRFGHGCCSSIESLEDGAEGTTANLFENLVSLSKFI